MRERNRFLNKQVAGPRREQAPSASESRYDRAVIYVDAAVLNATEWLCRRFQVLTGRTNVWLAVQLTNLSIILYFVWAAVSFWNTDPGVRIFVGLFCGGVLWALTQTVFKVPIEEYENNAYRRVARGYRGGFVMRCFVWRFSRCRSCSATRSCSSTCTSTSTRRCSVIF